MDSRITCRFYEELNDFLPTEQRKKDVSHWVKTHSSIKDVIESLGVPHTEVELILVNGKSVDFNYQIQNNDRISVYPVFESLDMKNMIKLRAEPLREMKFVLDCHLGKLAKYLRFAGFDTLYKEHFDDAEIAEIAQQENRIVLTRDRDLLKRKIIDHGHYMREIKIDKQFMEVMHRFDLLAQIHLFSRCSLCNGILIDVDKQTVTQYLEPKTLKYVQEFKQCSSCQHVYWKGSHYEKIKQLINSWKQCLMVKNQ